MHGAIQGGWVWNYSRPDVGAPLGVKGLLEQAGHQVFNPTLPFHAPYDHWSWADGQMTVQKYVDVYIQVIVVNNLQNVVLVGHSLAGVWMQMLLQQIPNRIASMVFIDAAILLPGESFFSNRIGGVVSTLPAFPAQAWFSLLFSYPLFYQQFTIDLYRGWMVNSVASNDALVQATYKMMVPEPHGPELATLDTSKFFTISKPKAFIYEILDLSLSTEPRAWLLFADRLNQANNGGLPLQVIQVQADHQGMLTNPVDLAASILKAISALDPSR
ncbi:g3191 [Coccomyxa elongata]